MKAAKPWMCRGPCRPAARTAPIAAIEAIEAIEAIGGAITATQAPLGGCTGGECNALLRMVGRS